MGARTLAMTALASVLAVAIDGGTLRAAARWLDVSPAAAGAGGGEPEEAAVAFDVERADTGAGGAAADEGAFWGVDEEPSEAPDESGDDGSRDDGAAADEAPGDGTRDDGAGGGFESLDEQPSDADEAADEDESASDHWLVATARETWVFAEPRWKSRRLGYLRAGAVVAREAEPATRRGCRQGWYRIEPQGYVCVGSRASLDRHHPVAVLSSRRPDRHGLPYLYAQTRYPTPPLYARVPSDEEQRRTEGDLVRHLRAYRSIARDPDFVAPPPPEPLPEALSSGGPIPALAGVDRRRDALVAGFGKIRAGYALLGTYDLGERRFGLTTELALVPIDRLRVVRQSEMRGIVLSDELSLPVAVVKRRTARSFELRGEHRLVAGERLSFREWLPLTGQERRLRGERYLETRSERWVRAADVAVVERFRQAPGWARRGEPWIDVSLLRQTLVAYEGTRPVFATLVSTGADGIEDHRESHATIQGTFRVHTKHLTVKMDSDVPGDEFDLRDVPFVQYFAEGYALHAAYWHDDFGRPRSHGCINLSPLDASWLFAWTGPEVPEGWHASLSLRHGTLVHIHP